MSERTPKEKHKRRMEVLQRRVEYLQTRIDTTVVGRDPWHDKAECSAIKYAMQALIENERLRDLIRYCRHDLHEEGLITNDEFVALVEVGAESARRLESYDAMVETIERLHAELKQHKAGRETFMEYPC